MLITKSRLPLTTKYNRTPSRFRFSDLTKSPNQQPPTPKSTTAGKEHLVKTDACGIDENNNEPEDDLEEMFVEGPAGLEWGGPTRGGRRPEPTRYGDWERNGRVSDF